MTEPRAKTAEEVRQEFLNSVRRIAKFWANTDRDRKDMCDGVAFSILNIFDGTSVGLPAMDISLSPHIDDKEFCRATGRNWYESGMVINDCMLHELYYEQASDD